MECLHCNLTAYTYKGELIKVEASNDFNVKGCMRGLSRTKWVKHKERVTTPLLRDGEKGKGAFKPISWDEALDLMEKKIRDTIAEEGHKGLFFTEFTGNMDAIKGPMGRAFFDYLGGATHRQGSICCGAAHFTMPQITGVRFTDTRDTIADSRYLLCWGNNPATTMHAYWKDFVQAKENGARIVVIDPRFSETAAQADEWIPIIPGTDTALALGMMKIIFDENLIDEPYLRAHTGATYLITETDSLARTDENDSDSYLAYDLLSKSYVRHDTPDIKPVLFQSELPANSPYMTVFERVRRESDSWTVKRTSEETSIPESTILRLSRDYATSAASMIIQNMSGAQRTEHGSQVIASQNYLPLLTGQIGKKGTGLCDAGGAANQMVRFSPAVPPAQNVQPVPPIPMAKIGRAIVEEEPHRIKFWYNMTFSPATQLSNTNMVKEAFKKVFLVVADNLMTDTAMWADLVLPVTTIFEDVSVMAGVRSHYVQLMEKAVEPPGEAKPDYWIFARMAERFGFGEVFNQPIEHYIENVLAGTGITIEQLRKGPVKPVKGPWIPYEGGKFYTSTGKANFYLEGFQGKGLPPVATYFEVVESPKGSPELAKKYPLMAVQRKLPRSVHSSHGTNEWIIDVYQNQPNLMIHPDDAKARGIKHGGWAIAYNDRGEHRAIADVSTLIKKGVVSLENGWWERQGGTSSSVSSDTVEGSGMGQSCNSTLINVRAEV